jgi:hypothetical protein
VSYLRASAAFAVMLDSSSRRASTQVNLPAIWKTNLVSPSVLEKICIDLVFGWSTIALEVDEVLLESPEGFDARKDALGP